MVCSEKTRPLEGADDKQSGNGSGDSGNVVGEDKAPPLCKSGHTAGSDCGGLPCMIPTQALFDKSEPLLQDTEFIRDLLYRLIACFNL